MSDEQQADLPEEGAEQQEQPGRLRSPLLDDGQPAFHWWLFLPGLAIALLWALYSGVTAEEGGVGEFVAQLLWPGPVILVVTTIAAWLGWRLDLD
ncbi:MAG: hypothetical protein F4X76_10670 [Chloroflexi bacterium]|nr:hypothetical protein [Chloroflexota bacterium]